MRTGRRLTENLDCREMTVQFFKIFGRLPPSGAGSRCPARYRPASATYGRTGAGGSDKGRRVTVRVPGPVRRRLARGRDSDSNGLSLSPASPN